MEFIDRAVRFKGDVERGRALFFAKENDACSRCHTVAGQGRAIGPDLTAIGAKYGPRALVEHIINPSAQIEESFKPVRIQTRNNDPVLGIMKENGDDAFVVFDSDGRQHTLRKEAVVRAERSELSLMPEVLHLGYSLEEFGDLVAFLATLKGTD